VNSKLLLCGLLAGSLLFSSTSIFHSSHYCRDRNHEMDSFTLDIGTTTVNGTTSFRVWAPDALSVEVELVDAGAPRIALQRDGEYFQGVATAAVGDRYWYWLNGTLRRPDPASRSQPDGVHGASQIIDPAFAWSDSQWRGITFDKYIFYELHVGTFTTQGTFDGVISRLDYLCELGITAVELMPVAQFPGERNWGYDGTFIFAPQTSYGDAEGLKRLVDACHSRGLAVTLDVVYNHLGPEGNYLHAFGPYFTDRYRTPWGDAVNYDGPGSDQVRHYFIANALYWVHEYHIDSLRLDAIHGIYDFSALHILQEITSIVHRSAAALSRHVHIIAESDLNNVRVINPTESGGYGVDAQWNDDFHHALRTLLTGDKTGYYADFGHFSDLAKSFREGFVLSGGYSSFRHRRHGSSSATVDPDQLVVFSQNHDQVGNRMRGERSGEHLSAQQLKLAAATVLLSPFVPLLFMGEEYAESAPFNYFVNHSDQALAESVKQGRLKEFAEFADQGAPPDPGSEETFLASKLNPNQRLCGEHHDIFMFYRELIRLRRECAALARLSRDGMQIVASEEKQVLALVRSAINDQVLCLFNFSDQKRLFLPPLTGETMRVLLDSTDDSAVGSCTTIDADRPETFPILAPFGVIVYQKE
jgi:maltooligosyltrehalose trehalohydrolase